MVFQTIVIVRDFPIPQIPEACLILQNVFIVEVVSFFTPKYFGIIERSLEVMELLLQPYHKDFHTHRSPCEG